MLEATIIAFGASITCLAQAVYFEARDQPTVGQMAVAQVVLNRVHDSRWPDTICEVIKEGPTYKWKQDYPVKHRCQFSFTVMDCPINQKIREPGIKPYV